MGEIPNSMKAVIQTAKAEEEETNGKCSDSSRKNAEIIIKPPSKIAK